MPPIPSAFAGAQPFVGRERELSAFRRFATGRQSVLNLYGIGGMGKSALLRRFKEEADREGWPSAVADAAGSGSAGRLLGRLREGLGRSHPSRATDEAFSDFDALLEEQAAVETALARSGGPAELFDALGQLKDPLGLAPLVSGLGATVAERVRGRLRTRVTLEVYLRGVDSALAARFGAALEQLTAATGRPAVIGIDTYEQAGGLDDWVCAELVESLPRTARLVIAGRSQLHRTNVDWLDRGGEVMPLALEELELQEARDLLRRYGLEDERQAATIADATGGWPLLLVLVRQLAADAGGWERVGTLERARDRDELASALLESIMREQRAQVLRDLLERAALAPWFDPPMIAALLNADGATARDLYDRLATHAFAERDPHGLRLHDRLAEMLRERLRYRDPQEFQRLRQRLDEHLRERERHASTVSP